MSAIALTVKSRSRKIGLDGVRIDDVRFAGVGLVRLCSMCRDLEGPLAPFDADGPEPLALHPDRVGPVGDKVLGLGRPGIGREVDVEFVERKPCEQVTHDPAHEVQTSAGRVEALGQRPRDLEYRGELLLDQRCERRGRLLRGRSAVNRPQRSNARSRTFSAAAGTSRPGPPDVARSARQPVPTSAPRHAAVESASASRS